MPSYTINESDDFIAILDAFPAKNGHTLVIPKKHSDNIFEMSDELSSKVLSFVKETKEILSDKLNPDGFYIRSNVNKSAGQVVFHTHIHIFPTYESEVEITKPEILIKKF